MDEQNLPSQTPEEVPPIARETPEEQSPAAQQPQKEAEPEEKEAPKLEDPEKEDEDLEEEKEGSEEEKEEGLAYNLYYWLQTLVIAVVFIVLLFSFVGRITRVVGDSMLQTLHNGDLLFIQSLGYTPQAGDIVVLNKLTPEAQQLLEEETIVKRIIATEGQQVDIDYNNSVIYVDGQPLEEPYLWEAMTRRSNPYMQQTSFVVPDNCVFVMGDNRNNSTDSRHDQLGMIDRQYILGRAVAILFPFSDFGAL